ncbi:MAG: restriction endonuclease subunit S [Bacteroidales bacterium]|nr:restriction endonuclease subunit S [Bacteroidales bacterium]
MTKWVTKKLGEGLVKSICTGKLDANAMVEGGAYRFYTCAKNYSFIDEYAFDDEALLISGNGEYVGYVHYYKGKFNAYQRTYVLRNFSIDIHFLQCYLNYFLRDRIKKEMNAGSIPFIKMGTLTEMPITYPESLAEQRRIAGILSSADGAIAASEALIAKYRNIKRGLLATLLQPKEGWKKVKLGECLTIGNGQDYKHLHKGDIPVYGTGGVMTYVDDYLYEGETVCIGRKGTINKPIFHCGKIWTVDTLFYTHSYVNVLPLFMYYAFCCIDWLRYNEATGVPSLSKETIYKIEINIPSDLAEQRRIAEILSSVDAKIAAEEKVVEKYKGVKKGLMEEMMKENNCL